MAIVRLRPEELKRALDEGALSLQFQPQVHVPSGKLVGIAPGDVEIECPRGSVRDPLLAEPVQRIRALGVRIASEEFGDPAIADAASGFDTLKIGYPLARDLTLLGSESLEAVQAIVEA